VPFVAGEDSGGAAGCGALGSLSWAVSRFELSAALTSTMGRGSMGRWKWKLARARTVRGCLGLGAQLAREIVEPESLMSFNGIQEG